MAELTEMQKDNLKMKLKDIIILLIDTDSESASVKTLFGEFTSMINTYLNISLTAIQKKKIAQIILSTSSVIVAIDTDLSKEITKKEMLNQIARVIKNG